ncbi:hypothetical protein D1872_98390 [compost metagenome]
MIRDLALPPRIGGRLPALFLPRAVAPIDSITRTGYGSYDQSATTAYNSFSNRALLSLERFPARFWRACNTYFSERSQPPMESHRIGAVLRFALRWTGLPLSYVFGCTPNKPPSVQLSSRQRVDGGQAGFTLHLVGALVWPRMNVATRK